MSARLLLLLALPLPALAATVNVGVIEGDSLEGSYADLVAALNDSEVYDIDAELVVAADVTGVADLSGYDVIVIGSSGHSDFSRYTDAFKGAMDGYATGGGSVVTAAWTSYEGPSTTLSWLPIDQASRDGAYCTGPTTVTPTVVHPIVDGVGEFVDTSTYWETPGPALAGSEIIATGCGGKPAITVREATGGVGRLVYIGGTYTGDTASYKNEGLRSGAADQLMEQAVIWASDACPDEDEDGVNACAGDCDDADPARFPGNPEVCDDIDNDCNDEVDDGLATTDFWPDVDEDGFGDSESDATASCFDELAGYADNDDDCDDDAAEVNPDAAEILDNAVDEDCDGQAQVSPDEGDDEDDGGCGCTSTDATAPMGLVVVLPLLIAGLRRRRR